jgi:hypothetical protein
MVNVSPGAKTVLSAIDCETHPALFSVSASGVKLESVAVTLTTSVAGAVVAWVRVEVGAKVAVGAGGGVRAKS